MYAYKIVMKCKYYYFGDQSILGWFKWHSNIHINSHDYLLVLIFYIFLDKSIILEYTFRDIFELVYMKNHYPKRSVSQQAKI